MVELDEYNTWEYQNCWGYEEKNITNVQKPKQEKMQIIHYRDSVN